MNPLQKLNPWNQELLAEVPASTITDFIQALQVTKQAQESFKKTSLEQRADLLRRWAEVIAENKNELSIAIAQEQGLSVQFTRDEIVDAAQKSIENLSLDVRLFPRPESISATGVIGMSVDWPMAFLWINQWVSQAVAAGNAVILHMPVHALISGQKLQDMLNILDLPQGLVRVLYGNEAEISPLISGHPGLAACLYSGLYNQSNALIEAASMRRKKMQFFLGGKNSSLIHPDFDFEKNIDKILRPALTGQGQLGVNTHRFYISQNHEKRFYEVLRSYLESLKPSSSPEDKSLWTPLISSSALQTWENTVQTIHANSGKVLSGGNKRSGLFVEPTFTQDLSNCSELQQDEIRAPFFIVSAVKYVHEMSKWTNTGYLGHSATLWTPDEKAVSLSSQLNVGQVSVNKWGDFVSWGVGQKQSFYGNPDVRWSGSFYSDVRKVTI